MVACSRYCSARTSVDWFCKLQVSGPEFGNGLTVHVLVDGRAANHGGLSWPASMSSPPGQASRSEAPMWWIDPHMIAGASSGFLATLLLHPLDLIKTRFHVQEHGSRRLPHYSGLTDAVRTIVRLEGWRGLYGGLAPNIVGNTASWGVYMLAYNRCKDALHERGHSGSPLYVCAATVAGALTTILLHPVFTGKTRLQLQFNTAALSQMQQQQPPPSLLPMSQRDNYAGFLNAVRRMVTEEGVSGLYRGIGPSMLLVSHGSIQFLTYEQTKLELLRRRRSSSSALGVASEPRAEGSASTEQLGANDLMLASTFSKVCAILCTYPYQVVRSCVQQRQVVAGEQVTYSGTGETVRHIWRLEGPAGFYRGIWPHMLRSTPQATITLMLYEYAMRALLLVNPRSEGGDMYDRGTQRK